MKIIYLLIFVLTLSSAQANIENCGITNKLLKEKNLGTFLQPTSSKIKSKKDSKEYTKELQLLNIQKGKKYDEFLKTKGGKWLDFRLVREEFLRSDFNKKFKKDVAKIEREFNASEGMKVIINRGIHYTSMTSFESNDKSKIVDFIFNGDSLVAISSRNSDATLNSKEDLLLMNGCDISDTVIVDNHQSGSSFKYASAELCRDFEQIKKIAMNIDNDVDDHKFNCDNQGGSTAGGGCRCKSGSKKGVFINPLFGSCYPTRRKLKDPPWIKFENFVRERKSLWGAGQYTRKDYIEIESFCSKYEGEFKTDENKSPIIKNVESRALQE